MNKQKALKIINPIIFILFLNQIITGYFHEYIPYEIFQPLHEYGASLFLIAVIVHIYLNWSWVKGMFKKKH
jgi:hypothetical protein